MYEIKLPRLGQTMQSGTITSWLVDEGDSVEKGDILFELQSEKSTLEVEAQASGILRKIIVPEDEEVPINTVIGIIADEDEEIDLSKYEKKADETPDIPSPDQGEKVEKTTPSVSKPSRRGGVLPKARKLAKELGVDLSLVKGTGRNGIVTEEDVRNAISSTLKIKETIKLNPIQKAMSKSMSESWQTIPQFTQMISVNVENVLRVKKELENVSLNAIMTKAIGNAVKKVPIVNSKLETDHISVFEDINISTAVDSPNGLVVPVLKNVESKSALDISNETKELVQKAENNKLSPEDYADGTITVSNLGSAGIEAGTPIINLPQSTIIFIGAIQKRPIVVENDEIAIVPIMRLSICFDHRFIDGATGAHFSNTLKNVLENLTVDDVL